MPSCLTPSAKWTPSMSSLGARSCTPRPPARPPTAEDAGVPIEEGQGSDMTQQGHKWFAAVYDRLMSSAERSFMKGVREEIAGGAGGRVLELGAGTGANFAYYGVSAQALFAIEPDPYMLGRARRRAGEAARPIDLRQAPAEEIPFEDASFDAVVGTP